MKGLDMFPDVDKITKQVTVALAEGQKELAKKIDKLDATFTRIAIALEKLADK